MNDKEWNLLLLNFEEAFKEARKSIEAIDFFRDIDVSSDPFYESQLEPELEWFNKIMSDIRLKLLFTFDFLRLPSIAAEFKIEYEQQKDELTKLLWNRYLDSTYSPALELFEKYFRAITTHRIYGGVQNIELEYKIRGLERILRATAKIISDRQLNPGKETEITNHIYDYLVPFFPDVVKGSPIVKIGKTYKPDIGIKSLQCAVEYKFADTKKYAKTCLDGIYSDIQGYEGSEDWKHFYAVVYMTDHFFTEQQIEEEFRLSKAGRNWKPIIVVGKGLRATKRDSEKSKMKF